MRRSLPAIFVVLIISALLDSGCLPRDLELKYRENQTRATDEAISNSAELTELNKVCLAVRLPDEFIFVSKGGIDDQKVSLSYQYRSDLSFEVARRIVEKQLAAEVGWNEVDLSHRYPKQLEFENGSNRIVLSYQSTYSLSNYSIYCGRLESKN
ncbi:MAG: hypothetical protein WBO68_12590 [Pyrinomonadaceae bacterium]